MASFKIEYLGTEMSKFNEIKCQSFRIDSPLTVGLANKCPIMHIPLTTITTFYILLDFADIVLAHNRDELDLMFRQRTRSEWEKAWHDESHSRCREKLLKHLYWACEKDIYRISRRSDGMKETAKRTITLPWLDDESAKTMLRTRRSRRHITGSGSSITSECCTKTGCTWEEYAEYCPTNKRLIKP